MRYKLEKMHWEKAKQDNINLILQNQMQIEMAKRVLVLIEEKLAKFSSKIKKKPGKKK